MTKNITYTIASLIIALKEFPQDLPVLVSGYENGFENPLPPEIIVVEHQPETPYWSGEFQIEEENANTFEVLVLRRAMRDS